MKNISLQVPEDLLKASGKYARFLQLSRSEYIRQAILKMNKLNEEETRTRRLIEASRKVRKESMRVNAEFQAIELDPDA